jgi:hypothetical protein
LDAVGEGHRQAVAWRLLKFKDYGEVYIVPTTKLSELSGGSLDHKAIAKALARRGFLIPNERGDKASHIWDYLPELGRVRSVVIPVRFVEDEDRETETLAIAA